MVYTISGDVLLLRRRQPADFWQSVTGSLHWEETDPLITARRELREETGLDDAVTVVACGIANRFPILPSWRNRYTPDATENIEHVFRVELTERYTILLNADEHSELVWLPRAAATHRVSSWTNREAILQLP